MKDPVRLFSLLGQSLQSFGREPISQAVIRQAHDANNWFSPDEIRHAVEAIRFQMLRPKPLQHWLSRYRLPAAMPCSVLVVMAGNIPLVGFFDLLCVLAAGHRCLVKPSGKDRILMEYIIAQMRRIDPEIPVEYYTGTQPVGAVIATGSDNANRHFRQLFNGIPTLFRGNRHSVAVLSGQETPAQLAALSDDIFRYSGMGCRSVSLLFVPHGCEIALRAPATNPKYRNNYLQARTVARMTGRPFRDLNGAILVEREDFPQQLSEIGCIRYGDLSEVGAWLTAHDHELQCVVTEVLDHPRRVAFGQAQQPGLTDYADDVDTMQFLLSFT